MLVSQNLLPSTWWNLTIFYYKPNKMLVFDGPFSQILQCGDDLLSINVLTVPVFYHKSVEIFDISSQEI